MNEILKEKETCDFSQRYMKYSSEDFVSYRIPEITVHGRFQPPLHVNHFYTYVSIAFQIANKVLILITNPDLSETKVNEASHRSSIENNPFTYDERIEIFTSFFNNIGMSSEKYEFKPFKITDEKEWYNTLDRNTPNLVNTYGAWSEAKLSKFQELGYKVIHSSFPKLVNVSGTSIRSVLKEKLNEDDKKITLIKNGLMPQSVDQILEVYNQKY